MIWLYLFNAHIICCIISKWLKYRVFVIVLPYLCFVSTNRAIIPGIKVLTMNFKAGVDTTGSSSTNNNNDDDNNGEPPPLSDSYESDSDNDSDNDSNNDSNNNHCFNPMLHLYCVVIVIVIVIVVVCRYNSEW